jgi:hypothetical protein
MLAVPIQAIDGTRTCTLLDSQHCRLLPLLSELTGLSPSHKDFYCRASGGLVTRSAAGYNYGGNWTISTGGTFTRWQRQLASLQNFRIAVIRPKRLE